jgi:GTPase
MSVTRTVALVGRPNVGKSRLFNRLAGRRLAIVHDLAGVTRDVHAAEVGSDYTLLDTGGIGLVVDMDHQKLIHAAEEQVWFAVEAATVICLVVDVRDGLTALDATIAARLRAAGKPVVVVANKADTVSWDDRALEFAELGFRALVPVSAEHGRNADQLHDALLRELDVVAPLAAADGADADAAAAEPYRVRLAFAGRPNVGKSSLCNRLLASDRLVVSEVPGTTRDAVTLNLDYAGKDGKVLPFALTDTAGLRKAGKLSHSIEFFSSLRSREAIANADIVFLVIDATEGVTRQDKTLAGEIHDAGKCAVLLVNKWDLAIDAFRAHPPSGHTTMDTYRAEFAENAQRELFFMQECPVLFVSALSGFAMDRVLRIARQLWETSGRKLPTPRINKLIARLLEERQPRLIANKRFRIYYSLQTGNRPFTFKLFCNRATKLEDNYRRYLESALIREFKLGGCPLRFELRGKEVRYAGKD